MHLTIRMIVTANIKIAFSNSQLEESVPEREAAASSRKTCAVVPVSTAASKIALPVSISLVIVNAVHVQLSRPTSCFEYTSLKQSSVARIVDTQNLRTF